MKKILFIAPFLSNPSPRSTRILNILKNTPESEVEAHVLLFEMKQPLEKNSFVKYHGLNFGNLTATTVFKRFTGKMGRNRLIIFFQSGLSYILRKLVLNEVLLYEIPKFIKNIRMLQKKYHFDNIVLVNPPSLYLALILTKKIKSQFIIDIGDPVYNNAAKKHIPIINRIKYIYEKWFLNRADTIIVTNQGTKEQYISLYRINSEKIKIISQGFDSELFQPINKTNSTITSENIKMIYAGMFYKELRDPYPLFRAIERLSPQKTILTLVGSNINKSKLGIELVKRESQKKLLKRIKKSNMLLYIDNSYGVQTSGKIFELLALKMPLFFIYSNESSPVYRLIKDYKGTIFIKNDSEQIYNSIRDIGLHKFEFDLNFDLNDYNWSSIAKSYFKIILS